jgi:hypothetical protein
MNIKQKLDYVFSHIESISIRMFIGFAVFLLSLAIMLAGIVFLSVAFSFTNVILSMFCIALLPVFHYLGKNILEVIDDSDQL